MVRMRGFLPLVVAVVAAPFVGMLALIRLPSLVQGLVQLFSDGTGFVQQYVGVDTASKFVWFNQFGKNASGTMVANESLGAVSIPSGATDGQVITITNSLISTTSVIFLSPGKNDPGKKLTIKNITPASGSATFVVNTVDAAATTGQADYWYWIIN